MRLAASSCNRSRQERRGVTQFFPARSRANAFGRNPYGANRRSGATYRPAFAQRWQWELDRANPALLRARQFFPFFPWNRARATVSCTFFRPHLPKVSRGRQFFTFLFFAHCQRVDRALNPNVEETKNVGCEKTIFWSHASPPPFFMVFSSPCPALNELVPCRKYEHKNYETENRS